MTFLQPAMLWAIPLIALPIVIHLINQRRYQTVGWGAMSFLLTATRMSAGHARLRQWLVLLMRTLALIGLLLVISRPLASGWLGLASGTQVNTAIVVLDRSPSMGQLGRGGRSKWEAALARLSEAMEVMPPNRIVLITESGPIEVPSAAALAEQPEAQLADATTDLSALFDGVLDYVGDQQPGACDVWVCSDLRRRDWQDESGRWQTLRGRLLELPPTVRLHLLTYPDSVEGNRSIRVTDTRRVEGESGPELLLSLWIEPTGGDNGARASRRDGGKQVLPIGLLLDGARSEFDVELTGGELERIDHVIPLDESQHRGWGRVSIPGDANPADNQSYFVYDEPAERRTLIVADDPQAIRPLELAASIAPDSSVVCTAEVVAAEDLLAVDWDLTGLVLWQSTIPAKDDAGELLAFVRRGGRVIFFPPQDPGGHRWAGLQWTQWHEREDTKGRVVSWTGDEDLLSDTGGGVTLPMGELEVARHCGLTGNGVTLATLDGGEPFLVRAATEGRNVYFCTTTADPNDSTLEANGVVLYAMIQRAAAAGARSWGAVRQMAAGELDPESMETVAAGGWEQVAGDPRAVTSQYHEHAGVYRHQERWIVVNRPPEEDDSSVVPSERLAALFDGVPWSRVDDVAGSDSSLVREIWRLFLLVMVAALLLEAALSLPKRRGREAAARGTLFPGKSAKFPGEPAKPRAAGEWAS